MRKELNYWQSGIQTNEEEANQHGEEDVEGGKEVDEEKEEEEKEKEKERGKEGTVQDGRKQPSAVQKQDTEHDHEALPTRTTVKRGR